MSLAESSLHGRWMPESGVSGRVGTFWGLWKLRLYTALLLTGFEILRIKVEEPALPHPAGPYTEIAFCCGDLLRRDDVAFLPTGNGVGAGKAAVVGDAFRHAFG
jgi:hypothetical protein